VGQGGGGAARTVIVVTHDPAVAGRASRVLGLHGHRVAEVGR
jgi:predicted ABC-type transport system involved in lysophospholipase L1 biosynthesis ATPase subunit